MDIFGATLGILSLVTILMLVDSSIDSSHDLDLQTIQIPPAPLEGKQSKRA